MPFIRMVDSDSKCTRSWEKRSRKTQRYSGRVGTVHTNQSEGVHMSYTHLTREESIGTFSFVGMGMSCWAIAARLGRNHTTLSRDLRHKGLASGYRI